MQRNEMLSTQNSTIVLVTFLVWSYEMICCCNCEKLKRGFFLQNTSVCEESAEEGKQIRQCQSWCFPATSAFTGHSSFQGEISDEHFCNIE